MIGSLSPDVCNALDDMLNESATSDQLESLAAELENNRRGQAFYLDYCQLQIDLRLVTGADQVLQRVLRTVAAPAAQAVQPAASSSADNTWRRAFTLSIAAGVAAVLLLLAAMAYVRFPYRDLVVAPPEKTPNGGRNAGVARISQLANCDWGQEGGHAINERLMAGELLDLRSGIVEIKFHSGAKVVVEGPAVFVPESFNGGLLKQGRLVASVNRRSAGFTLNTPHATIIDLGTEFGVELGRDGLVDVHVFEGKVSVDYHHSDESAPRQVRLEAQQAARFFALAPTHSPLPCEPDRFVRSDDLPIPATIWSDEFDAAKLHEAWTWRDPDGDDRYSLTDRPGYMRFHVGELEDAWIHEGNYVEGSPYLFRSLGDWPESFAMETLVDLQTARGESVANSIGGLLVYDGKTNRMAINLGLQNMAGEYEIVLHSPGKQHASVKIDTPMLRLKLVRRADKWFAYYGRQSSDNWSFLGVAGEAELSGGPIGDPRVGLIVKTWKTSPPEGASIDFKYFRVTSPSGAKAGERLESVAPSKNPQ